MNREDILNSLGFQTIPSRTDTVLPAMGIFGAGILVGAGLGLLFAPKPGRELRDDLRKNAEGLGENLKHRAEDLKTKAEDLRARLPDPREVLHDVQNAVTGGGEEPQKQLAGGGNKRGSDSRPSQH
jgi:gas vesicle protein